MPKISVIVPVYNVRDYLEKCVRSVQEQTFYDWELLLINDGSTDGSGELACVLAQTDSRIRVLDRPNGGVSAARNTGLDAAMGDYVTFLDSDDSVYPAHLETLFRLAETAGADVAASGMALFRADGVLDREIRLRAGVYTGTKAILEEYLLASEQIYGGCNKLFRRRVIADTRFAAYTRAEDALFCVQVLLRCSGYAVSEEVGYCYYRRTDSVTMRASDQRSIDQIRAWEKIFALLKLHAPALCPFVAGKICHEIDKIPLRSGACGKELKTAREKYYPMQFANGKLPVQKKLAAAIYHISPMMYYRLNGRRTERNGGAHE